MTIKRTVNGVSFYFELTPEEKERAFDECKKKYANEDLNLYIKDSEIKIEQTIEQHKKITKLYMKFQLDNDWYSNMEKAYKIVIGR